MPDSKRSSTEQLLHDLRDRDPQGAAGHIRDGFHREIAAEIDAQAKNDTDEEKISILVDIQNRDHEGRRFRFFRIYPPGFRDWTAAQRLEWENTGVVPAPRPTPRPRVIPYGRRKPSGGGK